MLTGVTAWHTLAATDVHQGDTVLMHGAAGGVGIVAIQLAARRGATVIATARPSRHDFLRELGAIPVAYGGGLADRVRGAAPGGVDVALDLVGTDEALDVSLDMVADRARIATIVVTPRAREAGIKLLGGAPGADPGTEVRNAARLDLAKLAGEGVLRVFVASRYPLSQVAGAAPGHHGRPRHRQDRADPLDPVAHGEPQSHHPTQQTHRRRSSWTARPLITPDARTGVRFAMNRPRFPGDEWR